MGAAAAAGAAAVGMGGCDAPLLGAPPPPAHQRLELLLREPATIDPALVTWPHEAAIAAALFEPLVLAGADGAVRPAVAAAWQVGVGRRSVEFMLHGDRRWSTGEPLTAADFAWAWRRNLDPELGAGRRELLFPIVGAELAANGGDAAEVRIRAPDAATLRVELGAPALDFLARLSSPVFAPLPRGEITGMGAAWTSPASIRGNGAYRLAQWDPGLGMTLHHNPHYRGPAPAVAQSIVVRFVRDDESPVSAFRTGLAQAADVSAAPTYAAARADSTVQTQLRLFERAGTWLVVFNTRKPPWNQAAVRRGLALALDRRALAARFDQPALPAPRLTPDSLLAAAPAAAPNVPAARAALAGAGFPNGRGLPPVRLTYHQREPWDRLAAELGRQWGAAFGLEVRADPREWRDFLAFANDRGDFDAAQAEWTAPYRHPASWLAGVWRSDADPFGAGWSNPQFDAHLDAAAAAADPAAQRTAYLRADALLEREAPAIPVGRQAAAYLLRPEVAAFAIDPITGAIDLSQARISA